jgi:hypothetical protein
MRTVLGSDGATELTGLARRHPARLLGSMAPYVGVACVTIVILIGILRLWEADLTAAFGAEGDSVCAQAWMKSVLDHGWFLHNPSLGAPWGSDLYDFPMTDNLHFFVIRLLCPLVTSPGLLFNLYFLLQFPLIACVAFFVLRRLNVADGLAVVGSILYAFLPYHLSRGLGHVFLASYYFVPVQVLLAVRLGQGARILQLPDPRGTLSTLCLACLLCFLVAGAGVYYAFFGCFLFLMGGGFALLQGRGWRSLAKAMGLCLATTCSLLIHLTPQIAYRIESGANVDAIVRLPADAELLGLKVAHLLLPVSGHRLASLAGLKARYLVDGYLNNENTDAALGLLGSCAFFYLLIRLLRRPGGARGTRDAALETLAALNLGAVLLGTIGGFGLLFNLLISSWIRAYNRISIFIAFMALAAGGLALSLWLERLPRRTWTTQAYCGGLLLVLALGIWDQTTPGVVPNYAQLKTSHAAEVAYFGELEAALPPGAMVFQLPYIAYPEARAFGRCGSYDHFRPYLATKSLRWSFGTFRGRPADTFRRMICACRVEQMLRVLVLLNYEGVLVDRYGYGDDAETLEQTLSSLTGDTPRASGDGRWSFFGLAGFRADLHSRISTGHWQLARADLEHPILPIYGAGFQAEEGPPDAAFRWTGSKSQLWLYNPEGFARMVEVEFDADRLSTEAVRLEMTYPGGRRTFRIGYGKQRFHVRLAAEPGSMLIDFRCDGKPVAGSGDAREMVYRMHNLTVLPESVP